MISAQPAPEPRHPDSDLRSRLAEDPGITSADVAARIRDSYDEITRVLSRCPGGPRESALDVGCGTGNKTFALATHYDRVLGLDARWMNVHRARRVASRGEVSRVRFVRADAGRYQPGERFSLVMVNGVSHMTPSRCTLLDRAAEALDRDGWMVYGEFCEGYGPQELERAIERRDVWELRLRLREIVAGCLGLPHYRFFLSRTVLDELARLRLGAADQLVDRWHGLPTYAKVWCQPEGTDGLRARRHHREHPDYSSLPAGVLEWRECYASYSPGRVRDERELEARAEGSENRLAPLLLYLPLAYDVLGRPSRAGSLEPVRRRAPPLLHPRGPDWERVRDVSGRFVEAIRARQESAA